MADLNANLVLNLIDRFSGPMRQARGQTQGMFADMKKLAGFRALSSAAVQAGQGLSRMGQLGRRAIGSIFGAAIEFEQEAANLRSILRNLTDDQFDQLIQKARELGLQSKFSAVEVLQSMGFMGKASLDFNEIMDGVGHTLDFAAAGSLQLGRASDIATDVLKEFGLESNQFQRVIDVLTVGSLSATTNIQQLGLGMSKVGPLSKELGISLEETTAFVAAFANVGLKGGIGGRSFRRVISGLINPSKQAKEALKDMNVSVLDAEGNMRRPVEIFADIAAASKKLPKGIFINRLARIFRTFGVGGAAEASSQFAKGLDNAGKSGQDLNDILQTLADTQDAIGTSADMARTQMDTTKGSMIKMKDAAIDAAIEIANLEIPREFFDSLTELIKGLTEWAAKNPGIADGLMKLFIGMTALTTILGPIIGGIGTILGIFVNWRFAMLLLGGSSGGAIGGMIKGMRAMIGPTSLVLATIGGAALIVSNFRDKIDALRQSSLQLQGDIEKTAPEVAKRLTGEDIKKREKGLEERADRRERASREAFESRGMFTRAADFVLNRQRDTAAEDALRFEAAALREELDRRAAARAEGPEALEKARSQIDVNLKVDQQGRIVPGEITSTDTDVNATVLGSMQFAGT